MTVGSAEGPEKEREEDTHFQPSRIRQIVQIPEIAWPTVILTFFAAAVQWTTFWLLHRELVSKWFALAVNSAAIFISFTPMHDASHGSVANRNNRLLNSFIGYLSASAFPVPFAAFRHLHMLHHRYTNQPEDPDGWAGVGPTLLLPLRWMTMEWKYYTLYLPNLFNRPLDEALATLAQLAFMIAAITALCCNGFAHEALYAWILPGRIAASLLAYFFDYLPHRPHDVPRTESIYRSTHVTSLIGTWSSPLTWPLLQQNYHNIHHLVPFIPFYQYATVWHALKDELLEKGTQVFPILPLLNSKIAKRA